VSARRRLVRSLGEAGEIEPETDGMLMEYDIDTDEFSQEVSRRVHYDCSKKTTTDSNQ